MLIMKKIYVLIAILCCIYTSEAQSYEYQVITSVESVSYTHLTLPTICSV